MGDALRLEPRISVNKLAEYIFARPRRRKRIILDQISPPRVKVITYEDARRLLARSLADPTSDGGAVLQSANSLRDRAATEGDGHRQSCLLASARAAEAFAPLAERIRPNAVLAVPGPRRNADFAVAGVKVGMTPDVCFIQPGTEDRVGAVKFHFPRSTSLQPEALQYVSLLLYEYLKLSGDSPRRQLCIAVDVFAGRFESTPRATVERLRNVEAACEEIAERWPGLYHAVAAQRARPGFNFDEYHEPGSGSPDLA